VNKPGPARVGFSMRRVVIVVGVLGLAGVAIALVWSDVLGLRDEPRTERAEPARDDGPRDDDRGAPWIFEEAEAASEDAPGERGGRWQRGEGDRDERRRERRWDRDSPEWQERRARWEARWREMVDIAALGPNEPALDADAVRAALSPGREALRECIGEHGGFRALRRSVRGDDADAGPPGRRTATFDVGSDGTVDPSTLVMDPPMPAPFAQCFETFFTSATFEDAGDGARIEVPMGPPGGGRGRRESRGEGRSFDRP
jgi:hypothetical protein